MPIPPSWHLISRGEHASSPESDQSSTAGTTGNVVPSNAFADDLFREKFMGIAKGGSNGEKIMRGFLIGLAIGLVVACFFCCWYPCCRPRLQNRRRRRRPRRGPPATDEEQNTAQNTTQETTQNTTNNTPPA
ncbi:uncharacterized protein B0J16DRAFT_389327 [Fusarium flagelliforme]|uniref:uncharacterized protein n=1 Tax=Fusarium flagelliforme TaxID=2675880 RepID=UPI001E8CB970|nr:uncharacterized protein B0J16DRAFT_389327 [Fusarium flagelliforme]KAH7173444.1 hypothetical protein B0J16DRAFT_389327 [Fusarium flagelliforme]